MTEGHRYLRRQKEASERSRLLSQGGRYTQEALPYAWHFLAAISLRPLELLAAKGCTRSSLPAQNEALLSSIIFLRLERKGHEALHWPLASSELSMHSDCMYMCMCMCTVTREYQVTLSEGH